MLLLLGHPDNSWVCLLILNHLIMSLSFCLPDRYLSIPHSSTSATLFRLSVASEVKFPQVLSPLALPCHITSLAVPPPFHTRKSQPPGSHRVNQGNEVSRWV